MSDPLDPDALALMPKQRGRKSAAQLSVIAALPGFKRPPPPEQLAPAEAEVWRMVVSGMKPEWINPACYHLLACYCQCAVTSAMLEREMRKLPVDDKKFGRLQRLNCQITSTMCVLATKLRLCPSASRASKTAYDAGVHYRRPWLRDDEQDPPPGA